MNAKCGLGSFSTARRFFQLWLESQKEPEIRPKPIVDVERPVSRVEINAKNAPLTPASPHRRLLTHFLRPRAVKNALTRPTQSYTANSQIAGSGWMVGSYRPIFLYRTNLNLLDVATVGDVLYYLSAGFLRFKHDDHTSCLNADRALLRLECRVEARARFRAAF